MNKQSQKSRLWKIAVTELLRANQIYCHRTANNQLRTNVAHTIESVSVSQAYHTFKNFISILFFVNLDRLHNLRPDKNIISALVDKFGSVQFSLFPTKKTVKNKNSHIKGT